jgi:MinD superfamily P-loop ATPase
MVKEVTIISGKGGTGKTIVAAALARLANNKIMADCDVDAADLHLLLSPRLQQEGVFNSGYSFTVDPQECTGCGLCRRLCRFNAVNENFTINHLACEGCGFCKLACPQGAIEQKQNVCGQWRISKTDFGLLVDARLGIGEENSGKLVSLVREKAKQLAKNNNSQWVIIDGSPGVGCPVIASVTGVDYVVVVTEPTISGLHDARRVIKVAQGLKVRPTLVINKYDLNEDMSSEIEDFAKEEKIPLLGKIKFDKQVIVALAEGKPVVDYPDAAAAVALKDIWRNFNKLVDKNGGQK